MALLVDRQLNVMGVTISQVYMRFNYTVDYSGESIVVNIANYASKNAYLEDEIENNFKIPTLKQTVGFNYSRENDGEILQFIHEKYKEILTTDVTSFELVFDPSTGAPLFDPSTGGQLTNEIISLPKFAEDSSISIVDVGDISIG